MPAIDYDPDPQGTSISLDSPMVQPGVYRVLEDGSHFPLPNVACIGVTARVGAVPWSARFRYRFDQRYPAWPATIEDVFGLVESPAFAGSPLVVRHEDRIRVAIGLPDGSISWIFDGFARLPQINVTSREESVTFEAIGTPERLWDYPVPGALMRDASDPEAGEAIWTDLPTRFNPDGKPNATPEGHDYEIPGSEDLQTPIFLDPVFLERFEAGEEPGRRWSLAMAARYLIGGGNAEETWVKNPDFEALDLILSSVTNSQFYSYIDWNDPNTYETEPIIIKDFDATGTPWPVALENLLSQHGFLLCFELETIGASPQWRIVIRRNDDNTHWKTLGLQARGATLDPRLTAAGGLEIQRDGEVAGNRVVVDTALDRIEASFILVPLFEVDPEDLDADRDQWRKGTDSFEPEKYRVYGIDECGEGHSFPTGGWSTHVIDLSSILQDPENPDREYVRRRRPAIAELLTRDALGSPRRAELWFARDATDPSKANPVPLPRSQIPSVYSREATSGVVWQQVTEGGWELLKDRLGIRVTTEDARAWQVTANAPKPVQPSGVLDLVRSHGEPNDNVPRNPAIAFRLTCVIEADRGLRATAERRPASTSKFEREARVDARDRFRREEISSASSLATTPITARNDIDAAEAYAAALRRENEAIKFAGRITIPRITIGVRLADKIVGLVGRNLYFGSYDADGEGDRYPIVSGLEWSFEGQQATTILLTDRRSEIG